MKYQLSRALFGSKRWMIRMAKIHGCLTTIFDVRNIDGASGAISSETMELYSGVFIDAYHAIYQPRFDPKHVVAWMFLMFPWEEGTLQLLKTIHVEKAWVAS